MLYYLYSRPIGVSRGLTRRAAAGASYGTGEYRENGLRPQLQGRWMLCCTCMHVWVPLVLVSFCVTRASPFDHTTVVTVRAVGRGAQSSGLPAVRGQLTFIHSFSTTTSTPYSLLYRTTVIHSSKLCLRCRSQQATHSRLGSHVTAGTRRTWPASTRPRRRAPSDAKARSETPHPTRPPP